MDAANEKVEATFVDDIVATDGEVEKPAKENVDVIGVDVDAEDEDDEGENPANENVDAPVEDDDMTDEIVVGSDGANEKPLNDGGRVIPGVDATPGVVVPLAAAAAARTADAVYRTDLGMGLRCACATTLSS